MKDDEPLLFHTGPRRLFPLVRDAVASVLPPEQLRWIGMSHYEADKCGSLNEFLALAPRATTVCSQIAALVTVNDIADRPAHPLAQGQTLTTGRNTFTWHDAPHMPHGWECGYLFEAHSKTLFCGDLFTQGGVGGPAVTESDVLDPSEVFRKMFDYFSHTTRTGEILGKLAATKPLMLACMHGSAWRGDGELLLKALAAKLAEGLSDELRKPTSPRRPQTSPS